jgi:hypothetical protein
MLYTLRGDKQHDSQSVNCVMIDKLLGSGEGRILWEYFLRQSLQKTSKTNFSSCSPQANYTENKQNKLFVL